MSDSNPAMAADAPSAPTAVHFASSSTAAAPPTALQLRPGVPNPQSSFFLWRNFRRLNGDAAADRSGGGAVGSSGEEQMALLLNSYDFPELRAPDPDSNNCGAAARALLSVPRAFPLGSLI